MPSERERGGLVGLKKPLVEAAPVTEKSVERTVLPSEVIEDTPRPPVSAVHSPSAVDHERGNRTIDEPTKPATFHLPVPLLQRLRATCRLKNTTMVDFVKRAIQDALERQRPTEDEIRKLLG